MTGTYARGTTATLTVQWKTGAGVAVNATAPVTITITRITGAVVVVGPTSTGVTHVSTGLDSYQWAIAADAVLDDYAVAWLDADGHPASDLITVTATGVSVDDVIDYIGAENLVMWAVTVDDITTYPEVAAALAAETVAQLGKVTYRVATDDVPVPDNSDLAEALKRRVQRNLSMRALPLSVQGANTEFGPTRIGGVDPEIRRLEAAQRKRSVG